MKKILITGAGGFIGSRLVEVLKETSDYELHILLRTISKAVRISRYPLQYFKGSIQDADSVQRAMQDCDAVVHCAHDFTHPDFNLRAAEIIARQCLTRRVQKLVYISSFAVHRPLAGGSMDEETGFNREWDYALNKLKVENIFLEYFHREGLPVVILRPTIVYGPFSGAWTLHTLHQMLRGRKIIPQDGQGICNAVYIDDVTGAILHALHSPATCNGQAYLVSGPDAITWRDFYQSHLAVQGVHQPVYWSREESAAWYSRIQMNHPLGKKTSLKKDPLTFFKNSPAYALYRNLLRNPALKKILLQAKKRFPAPLIYPAKSEFETLSCMAKVNCTKLKTQLGYSPGIPFQEGMRKTLLWIEWANLNGEQ